MTAIIDDRVAELELANAELQRKLDERTAQLKEALEQQTAAAEVLQVINSSPGHLTPVFEAMLEKATRLCEATCGTLHTYEGEQFRPTALYHVPRPLAELWLTAPPLPGPNSPLTLIANGRDVVHIEDFVTSPGYLAGEPRARAFVDLGGARSEIVVALRKGEALLGAITVFRQEVRPFTHKQTTLLRNFAVQAVIAMENARLLTETREALEQQTATAEVLQVINSSPGNLAPVFDAMLEKAIRLCDGAQGTLWLFDRDRQFAAAAAGVSAELAIQLRVPRDIHPYQRRLRSGERVFQIPDLAATETYRSGNPLTKLAVDAGAARTAAFVALVKDGAALGGFTIARREVRPFSDKQIALLQNFAAQAVIAMENARLMTETREALEQQTATAEVLQVINSSPGDLAPVFDAMLDRASELCGAAFGCLWTYDGERMHAAALRGGPPAFAEFLTRAPHPVGPDNAHGRLLRGEPVVHIADVADDEAYRAGDPVRRHLVELGGGRTLLAVPLHKDGQFLGDFVMYRTEVRPFSDKQIALLQNFAAQAVIAMENARLLTETREALEQQTATAEVLQVINSSPGNLAPVFDAMLAKAMRLCEAAFGILLVRDGSNFRTAALHGVPSAMAEFLSHTPREPGKHTAVGRMLEGEDVVQFEDMKKELAYLSGDSRQRAFVELGGTRTYVAVALRRDGRLVGTIGAYRQEVRPFTDKQIALLQNFAAQAVIAMENARLITETREALEQQTATAEVLGVINSSPGDLAPVFDAILEKAHGLCRVARGSLELYDGQNFRAVATHGLADSFADQLRQGYPASDNPATRPLIEGQPFTQILDLTQCQFPFTRGADDALGARTLLCVPLRRDDKLLGMIVSARLEVQPFTEKQIALLQNFAAQAVIAMENARLLTETREALEQQTATAEVLQVINSSPGDLAPVFDEILEKATSLCNAPCAIFWTYDGEHFKPAGVHGAPEAFAEFLRNHRGAWPSRSLAAIQRGETFVHNIDLAEINANSTDPLARAVVDLGLARTGLLVPLLREGALLGAIRLLRREVRPFTDKEIALLQNFAAQAMIAMENARLLAETREALEQQTATTEVLQVINSSPGDLTPVFDAILEKAHTLCGAALGSFCLNDGERMPAVATRGYPEQHAALAREGLPTRSEFGKRLARGEITHIPDLAALEAPSVTVRSGVEITGSHTYLAIPLRKDGALLGYLSAHRQEVKPFNDKQIALLHNFAAQAVIAMENARLITELRESLEYQTATSDVLKVISRSVIDLDAVLDTVLTSAVALCRAEYAVIFRSHDGEYRWAASHGLLPEYDRIERAARIRPGRGTLIGRVALEGCPILIADAWNDPLYGAKDDARIGNVRSMLGVPLLREGTVIGAIGLARGAIEPYSEREIQLATTFADQAVIAIENARLFNDLRQRTRDLQESLEYQTASGDVLKVISQSGGELEPVLDTLVKTAARLCDAEMAFIHRREGEVYRPAAVLGFPKEFTTYLDAHPLVPGRGSITGRVALEGRAIHVADVAADQEYELSQSVRMAKQRTTLGVPLLLEDVAIGVIVLARQRVLPFTEKQIGLVTTFADQAVIAIENARLFNELRARTAELGSSVEELKMLSEVGRAVSSTLDLRTVLSTILNASLGVTWANAGAIFRYIRAERAFRLVEAIGWDEPLLRSVRDLRVAEAETAMGEAAARRMPIQIADLAKRPSAPLRDASLAAGFRSALIVPLVGPEHVLGAIILMRQEVGEFPLETVRLMQTLASQSVLAIQNARLFREIADKSEQLALASQHKSQFLANMSHELRTPLNAILGYAELLVDGIYGQLPDRPRGVLERIQNNGKHLLALINDVLDLAKIEAGQLALTLEDYNLAEVVQTVVTATEPLASAKGLKFVTAVQNNLPMAHGDARRVSQVLLNLLGNAIKFTEAGEVEIRAIADKSQFVLTVRDTGPGIADADQERIFGEFQQIDNSNTRKQGGTGLGLAISKRMVEMQGGTIAVDSTLGQGSTFRVLLPIHVDQVMEEAA
jgi:GAF domain-containing protein/anti-sigma regulatory factor (Ser/Thr protein kinase)